MAKTKQQKKEIVKNLSTNIKNAKGVVFSSYIGLKVSDLEELRKSLRTQKAQLYVSKKTLLKLALKENGYQDINVDTMDNGVIVATGEDEVQPAKLVEKFRKTHKDVKFYGGIMEGKFIDTNQVLALAALPGREELLAKLVGSLNSPISGFVNVLAGNLRGLVTVLKAIKDKK